MDSNDQRDHAEDAANRAQVRQENAADLAQRLVLGARDRGYLNDQAAVHLLTFGDIFESLANYRPFRDRLTYNTVTLLNTTEPVEIARVQSWTMVIDCVDELNLGSTAHSMANLAASLAHGSVDVNLRTHLVRLSVAYGTRIIEAIAIAVGLADQHDITVVRRKTGCKHRCMTGSHCGGCGCPGCGYSR